MVYTGDAQADPSEGRERARQEFLKWLPSFAASLAWREPYNPAQLESAFEAGRRSLEQERWISVEERLPDVECKVLVLIKGSVQAGCEGQTAG